MDYLIGKLIDGSPSDKINPHKHKNYEIIFYIRGRGIFYADNAKEIEVAPGRVIIVPPGVVHHSTLYDDFFERIYINGEFNHIFKLEFPVAVADNPQKDGLNLVEMIFRNRFSNTEYINSLVNALAHFLVGRIKTENEVFAAISGVAEEITNNFYNYDLNPCMILKKSGYSEDYIRSMFKKATGKTPTEFLTEARISHARYLIDTYKNSLPMSVIAEKCGYTDYIYFSRKFKQITGKSPRAYMEDNVYNK